MVIIFDLDDTLYDEMTFVRSGMRAVAEFLHITHGLPFAKTYERLIRILEDEGRGRVFDIFLRENGYASQAMIKKCLSVYRLHQPSINVFPGVLPLLQSLKSHSLYLVTDGNKVVQYNKVHALGIESFFKGIYITHRYGIANAKPSIYCFEKIRSKEKCQYREMVYIADNPVKDFVNIRKLGIHTVRVLTGSYKQHQAMEGYDAEMTINHVKDFAIEKLKKK